MRCKLCDNSIVYHSVAKFYNSIQFNSIAFANNCLQTVSGFLDGALICDKCKCKYSMWQGRRSRMFCCSTLIGGCFLLIIFIFFLAKKKKSLQLQSRCNALKDKANSWDDTEITEFDPRTKICEEDFTEMIGKNIRSFWSKVMIMWTKFSVSKIRFCAYII